MRQRNPGPSPLMVPSIPAEVPVGGEVDWPEPLCGFEPVEAPPEPAPSPPADSGHTTKARKGKAADPEEVAG